MPEIPLFTGPESFKNAPLDENSVNPDPFRQFSAWYRDAVDSGVAEPEAMFLATAGKNGIPSGRIVLLKGFGPDGLVFFTNYTSRKGSDISGNPFIAVAFHWKEINRQVRITGKAKKIHRAESDEYFFSRPLESRISAMISSQGKVIPGRDSLVENFNIMKRRLAGDKLRRPPHWGGFRITPLTFEFWQSRPHRLHDRIQYRLVGENWIIERLSP